MVLATMVLSPKSGKEYVSEGRVFSHPKTKPGTILGGEGKKRLLLQPWAVGSYLNKSPIMFCVHTHTLRTSKEYLNRVEEVIIPTLVC